MNKKGFTLVEVVIVVVILGIIIGIAVPSYIAVSNNIKEKNYNQKMDNIKSKALEYATDNNVESITIPVKALIEEGYLAEENPDNGDNEKITNPLGGYLDCANIDIVRVDDSYEISFSDTSNCNTDNIVNNSKITIDVYEYRNNTLGKKLGSNGDVSWTNSDKVLLYADVSKLEGIGSDTTWNYGTLSKKKSGNIATSLTVDEAYANIYVVEALVFLNSEYTFSINTNSGVATQKVDVKIDREKPIANASVESNWTNGNKKATLSGSDGSGSGIKSFYLAYSETTPSVDMFNRGYSNQDDDDYTTVYLDAGKYYLYTLDNAGNISDAYTVEVSGVDKNGPVCKYSNENTTWTTQDQVIRYGCDQDSGTGCKVNSDTVETIKDTTKYVDRKWTIEDNIGNKTECSQRINVFIDKVAPTIKFKNSNEYIWESTNKNISDYYDYSQSISEVSINCNYNNTKDLPFGKNGVSCTIRGGSGLAASSSTVFHHQYTAAEACSGGRYLQNGVCKMNYYNDEGHCGCNTWRYCQSWNCGSTVNTCRNSACGVEWYNTCSHSDCGVAYWASCSIPACGVAYYNTCQNSACGRNPGYYVNGSCKSYKWNCVRAGVSGSYVTYGATNPYPGHCANGGCVSYNRVYVQGSIKSCATSACGVGAYNSCQNQACGVGAYNSCATAACGVGAYRNCQTEGCGRTPNSCRTSACGCERGNDCTLTEQQYHYYYCHRTGNTGGKGDLNGSTCTFN